MKYYVLPFAVAAAVFAGCEARVENPPASENKTTIINPPSEKKTETNTTVVNPPAENKTETNTTTTTKP